MSKRKTKIIFCVKSFSGLLSFDKSSVKSWTVENWVIINREYFKVNEFTDKVERLIENFNLVTIARMSSPSNTDNRYYHALKNHLVVIKVVSKLFKIFVKSQDDPSNDKPLKYSRLYDNFSKLCVSEMFCGIIFSAFRSWKNITGGNKIRNINTQ